MKRRNFLIKLTGLSSGALLFFACSKSELLEPIVSNSTILDAIKDRYGEIKTKTIEPNRENGSKFPPAPYLIKAGNLEGDNLIYLIRNNSTFELFLPSNELTEQMIPGHSIEVVLANEHTKELPLFKF